jgi:hypothetical protein
VAPRLPLVASTRRLINLWRLRHWTNSRTGARAAKALSFRDFIATRIHSGHTLVTEFAAVPVKLLTRSFEQVPFDWTSSALAVGRHFVCAWLISAHSLANPMPGRHTEPSFQGRTGATDAIDAHPRWASRAQFRRGVERTSRKLC